MESTFTNAVKVYEFSLGRALGSLHRPPCNKGLWYYFFPVLEPIRGHRTDRCFLGLEGVYPLPLLSVSCRPSFDCVVFRVRPVTVLFIVCSCCKGRFVVAAELFRSCGEDQDV